MRRPRWMPALATPRSPQVVEHRSDPLLVEGTGSSHTSFEVVSRHEPKRKLPPEPMLGDEPPDQPPLGDPQSGPSEQPSHPEPVQAATIRSIGVAARARWAFAPAKGN